MTLISYLGDPKLKADMVEEMALHIERDQLIKGTYHNGGTNGDFKACAVGCSIHSLNVRKGLKLPTGQHRLYETHLGFPEWVALLEDTIFEHLPEDHVMEFPLNLLKAVRVGVDLTPVKWKFCAYLMQDNIERVLSLNISEDIKTKVVAAIRGVLAVHESAIKSGKWDSQAADSAYSAARSAARSADSAAYSAAYSAYSAAYSAARSAAYSADSAAYVKHAQKLLELLADAK